MQDFVYSDVSVQMHKNQDIFQSVHIEYLTSKQYNINTLLITINQINNISSSFSSTLLSL